MTPPPSPGSKRRVYRAAEHQTTGVTFTPLGCSPTGGGAPPGTNFASQGGGVMTNVKVHLIFWGSLWATSLAPQATQITSAVENLLAGPYMNYLAQYGVHRGRVRGTSFVTGGDPPNPFTYADISNFVIGQLDADNLPEPDSDWPILYTVIMPTNSAFAGDSRLETVPLPKGTVSGVAGANSSIVWNDYDLGDVDNDPAHFCWVGNDGTVDYVTTVLSHELAEACTDPDGGKGIRLAGGGGATGQIGDPCTGICDFVRGVKAQSYWSELDGRCVMPKLYSVRRTLAGHNIGGHLRTLQTPIPSLNQLITSLF